MNARKRHDSPDEEKPMSKRPALYIIREPQAAEDKHAQLPAPDPRAQTGTPAVRRERAWRDLVRWLTKNPVKSG
jgi:hypothetical protein